MCWSLADADTRERELGALKKLNARTSLKRMVVVTYAESERVKLPGRQTIEIMPLAEWLLELQK